jgi:hypothetical protein
VSTEFVKENINAHTVVSGGLAWWVVFLVLKHPIYDQSFPVSKEMQTVIMVDSDLSNQPSLERYISLILSSARSRVLGSKSMDVFYLFSEENQQSFYDFDSLQLLRTLLVNYRILVTAGDAVFGANRSVYTYLCLLITFHVKLVLQKEK